MPEKVTAAYVLPPVSKMSTSCAELSVVSSLAARCPAETRGLRMDGPVGSACLISSGRTFCACASCTDPTTDAVATPSTAAAMHTAHKVAILIKAG